MKQTDELISDAGRLCAPPPSRPANPEQCEGYQQFKIVGNRNLTIEQQMDQAMTQLNKMNAPNSEWRKQHPGTFLFFFSIKFFLFVFLF